MAQSWRVGGYVVADRVEVNAAGIGGEVGAEAKGGVSIQGGCGEDMNCWHEWGGSSQGECRGHVTTGVNGEEGHDSHSMGRVEGI